MCVCVHALHGYFMLDNFFMNNLMFDPGQQRSWSGVVESKELGNTQTWSVIPTSAAIICVAFGFPFFMCKIDDNIYLKQDI